MKSRIVGLLMALVLGASAALAAVPSVNASVPPICTSNCATATSTPNSVEVSANGSLSFPGGKVPPPWNPPPSGIPTYASCSGQGWQDYGIGLSGITKTVMSGVNVRVASGVGLVGDSPMGGNFNYSRSPFNIMSTYPTVYSPTQNWFVAWEGTWTGVFKEVASTTTGTVTTPAHWVMVNGIDTFIPTSTRTATTTTYTKIPTGCALTNLTPQYFYEITPCVSASCIKSKIPPLFPQVKGLVVALRDMWSPGKVVSSPPAGAITVWVPTQFSLSGGSMPPTAGITKTQTWTIDIALDGSPRILTIMLAVNIMPVAVDWTYHESGGQSGAGFTCTFTTSPYISDGGQNSNNCTSPNVGIPGGKPGNNTGNGGYDFTHDATVLTVSAQVFLSLSATATWTINGASSTEAIPLGGLGSEVLSTQKSETSTVQQVEGITVP